MSADPDVVVVGAGLAGLRAARELHRAGLDVVVLEASDDVGGRARTDVVDGFRLDRGFAIHNLGYPEAVRALDQDALDPRPFVPGALVVRGGRRHRLVDPRRIPSGALGTAATSLLSWRDKAAIGTLSATDALASDSWVKHRPETSTGQALRDAGVSDAGIETFLRPFLQGVLLEDRLDTSSQFFHLVWRSFARGSIVLPALGIHAIARQLAAGLPELAVRLDTPVESLDATTVRTATGEQVAARAVVVATDSATAGRLLPGAVDEVAMNGVTTMYHVAPQSPLDEPILLLDSDDSGLVANTTVVSQCATTYSPDGRALIETSTVGARRHDPGLVDAVTERIARLYDLDTASLDHLATYSIDAALPAMPPPLRLRRPVTVGDRRYVCGDHRDTGSIQGALVSGRRGAEAVLRDLGVTAGTT